MSSLSRLKDLAEQSDPSSVRAVVSTLPLPYTKTLLERQRRRLLLLVLPSAVVTSIRPLSRRRFTPISTASVVA